MQGRGCFRDVDEIVLEPTEAFVVHTVPRSGYQFLIEEFFGIGEKYICFVISEEIDNPRFLDLGLPPMLLFFPIYDKTLSAISLPLYCGIIHHKNLFNILNGLDQSFNNMTMTMTMTMTMKCFY